MNRPSEQDLERLRVRIAELCGWGHVARWEGHLLGTNPSGNMDQQVPDYCRDLNAVHETWRCLGWQEKNECVEHLQEIVKEAYCEAYFAEAWQRCIALDRTLSEDPLL